MNTNDPHVGLSTGRARERLHALSTQLLDGTRDVANESERWFLGAIRGLDYGVQRTCAGMKVAGARVARSWDQLRCQYLPRKSPKERLRTLMLEEARRAQVDPSAEEFQSFAQNMATLIELVVYGAIDVRDVAFAFDSEEEQPESSTGSPESNDPCNSLELDEEVSNHQQAYEPEEEETL